MILTLSHFAVFHPRRRSLLRGTLLVLGSFALSFRLSGFPLTRANLFLVVPALLAGLGTIDTFRCMPPRRNLYHAGVTLCLIMDMLAMCLILFFLFFPYLI